MNYLPKKLSTKQLDRISEFSANLGLVFFAGLVLPVAISVDKINVFAVVLGIVMTILSLVVSIVIIKK